MMDMEDEICQFPTTDNPLAILEQEHQTEPFLLQPLVNGAAKIPKTEPQKQNGQANDAIASTTSAHADDDETESIRKEVYLPYAHREWVEGCKPHPCNIVEPASLAVIETDLSSDYDVTKSLPPKAIKEGRLSSLQLESVIKAAHRHKIVLPNGERAGFFIGDAAGVGKGRQIAGVIMDNFCRGRKRHVWFSVSNDLVIDAERDLRDIGCYINVINGCKAIEKGTKLFGLCDSVKSGVVFSTYSTLVSSALTGAINNVRRTRLGQLIDWCGGEQFDGCLVFDECHKAKNFTPGVEDRGSKVALAVSAIQRALPKARVLYCSATGVTDTKNMAFMERLGLWGVSSAFKDYECFLETVQKKGLGIAEMLAMDMKREGMYVSRMLSFEDAQFVNMECNLTDKQRLMYNMAAHLWNETRKSLATAISRCHCQQSRSRMFWSQHQKFFNQLCVSMKVDVVVEETMRALQEGKCVVIGLQNTGEANMEGRISKEGAVTGFISSCREILLNFLETHFPIEVEYAIQPGVPPPIKKIDEWSLQARSMLIQYAKQLELYDSSLDAIIDKLGGPSQVAEMTGRRARIVRNSAGKAQYELRQSTCVSDQSLNVKERDLFMSGKKLIAIISDAASTGISLHADRNCKNQRQRVHITLQLPWSADKAVQQLGRSHRSNQVSGPIYKLLTTELGGERRFAASVARRLQSLGALTKGDRRAASVVDLSQFNYDTLYGRSALRLMYNKIVKGQVPESIPVSDLTLGYFTPEQFYQYMKDCVVTMGLLTEGEMAQGLAVSDNDSRDVSRFLNRILGLQVVLQNMIFNYFTRCLDVIISVAKKEGKFNEGFVDLTGKSMNLSGEPKPVFSELTKDSRQLKLSVDRGMSWEEALKRFEALKGNDKTTGFYKSRNRMYNRFFYMLITPKENSNGIYKITRPNTGVNVQEVDLEDIEQKYERIALDRAVGKRKYSVNLICGSLLRILPVLEQTMFKHSLRLKLSKYESTVKVLRVCLDNGDRLIGIQYPDILTKFAEREAKALAAEKQQSAFADMKDVIEPFTPVVSKLFERASKPPNTIFTYFTAVKENLTNEQKFDALKPSPPPILNKEVVEEDDDIICIMDTTPSKTKATQRKSRTSKSNTKQDPEFTPPSAKRKTTPKSCPKSDPEFTPPAKRQVLPTTAGMPTRSVRRKQTEYFTDT